MSIPHAGLRVPDEVAHLCILNVEDTVADGDEGSTEVYFPLRGLVMDSVTTDVARAIVDQNRARDDFSKDGVIKTHTCWDVPVYSETPDANIKELLLARYYEPFHERLRELAASPALLGIDCHTMAATAPPIGPDPGVTRPMVCLSDGNGTSCPHAWVQIMTECLAEVFDGDIRVNHPFTGGYITKTYGRAKPWLQLELNRTDRIPHHDKSARIGQAFTAWAKRVCG